MDAEKELTAQQIAESMHRAFLRACEGVGAAPPDAVAAYYARGWELLVDFLMNLEGREVRVCDLGKELYAKWLEVNEWPDDRKVTPPEAVAWEAAGCHAYCLLTDDVENLKREESRWAEWAHERLAGYAGTN